MKKTLIFISLSLLFFLSVSASASALSASDFGDYYNFTNTNSMTGKNNLTNVGMASVPGLIGEGVGVSGTSYMTRSALQGGLYAWTCWFNSSTDPASQFMMKQTTGLECYIDGSHHLLCGTNGVTKYVQTSSTYASLCGLNTYCMVTFVLNNTGSNKVYINNQSVALAVNTYDAGQLQTAAGSMYLFSSSSGTLVWPGQADECSFWTKEPSQTDINEMWNGGAGKMYPFFSGPPDKIIFQSQVPANITAMTAFSAQANITYNYTLTNLSDPKLNYTLTGAGTCLVLNNQTCLVPYNSTRQAVPSSNVTSGNNSLYSFLLGENDLYAINENLNSTFFAQAHQNYTLATDNYLFSTEFLNVSGNMQFNILEVMSLSNGISRVYACNSTYAFNSNVVTNTNCQEIGSVSSTSYNHSHGANSAHNLVPFTILSGRIGGSGIFVTPQMFFIVRGPATGTSNVSYVLNSTRANLVRTSINTGVTWTSQTWTTDSHLHQYPTAGITLSYFALGTYNGTLNYTSTTSDLIDIPSLNPQPPILTNPLSSVQASRYLNITWQNATATYPGANITAYNLTLLNADLSFNRTINGTLSLVNSALYDVFSQNLTAKVYYVRVCAFDTRNLSSCDEEFFNLTAETEITFRARDYDSGANISAFSFNITRSDGYFYQNTTSNGTALYNTLRGLVHNITIDATGYAYQTTNFTSPNLISSQMNFTLYKTNSILISIVNEATLAPILQEVNVTFVGFITYTFNTTNGTLFVSNISADYYEIKFDSAGYSPKSYFVTITNRTTQTLTALLSATYSGIGVYLRNAGDEPITGGLITVQRFINSSYITIAQGQTDGIGYSLFQLENGVNYLWTITSSGYVPKQFLMKPYQANQPYIFKMINNVTSSSLAFNEYVNYFYTPMNKSLMNGSINFTFTTISKNNSFGSNSVLWTSLNCNGSTTNVSGSPSGATVVQTLNATAYVGQKITCVYGLRVDGYPAFYLTNIYTVTGYPVGQNGSLVKTSEDFKDDTPEAWRGIFAMFVLAFVVLVVYEFARESRDLNLVMSVAGFATLAFLAFLDWVNLYMSAIIIIEGAIMYYSNRGGY